MAASAILGDAGRHRTGCRRLGNRATIVSTPER